MTSAWLQVLHTTPEAQVRLICLAASGCGASTFRAWLPHLPPWLELIAVQPPGREGRAREAALRHIDPIVDALVLELSAVRAQCPYALFGHSLGGHIAFELARRLEADGGPAPAHVLVAASIEPSARSAIDRRCHLLPAASFEAYVAAFGNFPEELRRHPRQFDHVMQLLRADLEVFATLACASEPLLRAPLTVMVARGDRSTPRTAIAPWATRAAGAFALEWFEGGHFFPIERAQQVAGRVAALLDPAELP